MCTLAVAMALLFLAGEFQTAGAQGLLKRARERAQEQIEKRVEKRTEEAVDKAVDTAVGEAEQQVEGAIRGAVQSGAGEGSSGQSGGTVTGGGADAGAAAAGVLGALGALAGAAGDGSSVEPIDHRELRALLPESLPGRSRTSARGESGGFMGIKTSMAEGEYGDGGLTISITDMGTMRGLTLFASAWLMTDLDVENDRGFERTVKYKGFPAYEKVEKDGNHVRAEMQASVGNRFIVSVTGNRASLDEVRSAMDRIDLAKLDGMKEVGLSEGIEPVDHASLRALLPGSVAGLSRTNASGEKTSALGIKVSSARGEYGGGNGSVNLSISDMGTLNGLTMLGYAWLMTSIETESDTGYERTTQYRGFPAFEKFDKSGDTARAEMQVVVDKRFIVSAEGRNVGMDQIRAALDGVDLAKLSSLK
jgi:hypothetical protein